MSEISPISRPNASSLDRVDGPVRRPVATPARSRGSDRVELSAAARALSRLAELPDIRHDLVNRVRQEIASGTYETPDKVDATIQHLAEDLDLT